jgi:holo-[acyl-carrier protein] synthase
MILGTGNDIVDIRRIEQLIAESGEKFIARIFTPHEQETCNGRKERAGAYAKRFAAKEACAKALGSGIGSDALFTEIEVSNDERGAPCISLSGSALARLQSLTPASMQAKIFLALSDEKNYALAHVIIEARQIDL